MSVALGMPSIPSHPVIAPRRASRKIQVGKVAVGGDAPISVQSMCTTPVSYTHLDVYKRQVLQVGAERFWALETEPASVSIVTLWPDGNVSVPLVNRTDHLH